jgi:hypothetical protein
MRNAHQILDIIMAAFGSKLFDMTTGADVCSSVQSETEQLACEWHDLSIRAKTMGATNKMDNKWVSDMTKVRT